MANGKTLIRGAYILTMDEELGTIRDGDIHIEGDRIIAVGRGLTAEGAEVIDGTDCIVLPGFVDTHRHMWGAMLRGCACYGDLGRRYVTVSALTVDEILTTTRSVRKRLDCTRPVER